MSKRLNKIALLLIASPLLFSCTDTSKDASSNTWNDMTGTKVAEVVGFETNLYLDIDGNYNQNSPLYYDDSHIYDVDKTSSYYFVVIIKKMEAVHFLEFHQALFPLFTMNKK